jgi:hypothetical protein
MLSPHVELDKGCLCLRSRIISDSRTDMCMLIAGCKLVPEIRKDRPEECPNSFGARLPDGNLAYEVSDALAFQRIPMRFV